uniref:Uncharacterized protein n=1 Tax=Caenorhabditis japonica TaxID=281687 RepID=A0A8R1IPQ3_CAEJA
MVEVMVEVMVGDMEATEATEAATTEEGDMTMAVTMEDGVAITAAGAAITITGDMEMVVGMVETMMADGEDHTHRGRDGVAVSQFVDYVGLTPRFYCHCPPYPPNYQWNQCSPYYAYGK